MNEFRFICARLILDERVLKILSVTERHIMGTSSFMKSMSTFRIINSASTLTKISQAI